MEAQATPGAALRWARSMARLYGGPLLDGVALADTPELELWLTASREQLHELHLRALHQIVAAERADGRWPQVLVAAWVSLAHDPLQEPMYRALIEAHAQLGDRAAALRQYDHLAETLERELGVAPLPDTEVLREAAMRGELQALPSDSYGPSPQVPGSPAVSPARPFAGRTIAWNHEKAYPRLL